MVDQIYNVVIFINGYFDRSFAHTVLKSILVNIENIEKVSEISVL